MLKILVLIIIIVFKLLSNHECKGEGFLFIAKVFIHLCLSFQEIVTYNTEIYEKSGSKRLEFALTPSNHV